MNRPRWISAVLCLLIILGGIGWWLSLPSDVRITFHGYHEENGARFAVVSLENHTSKDIIYPGIPGVPYCLGSHQRDVKPPFRVAVKFTTEALISRQLYLQFLRIPKTWSPPMEETVWTDIIDK